MSRSPTQLDTVAQLLAKLPGVGPRSARRMVLHLLQQRNVVMSPLIAAMQQLADTVTACTECGNLDDVNPCHICSDTRRLPSQICVVEQVADLWAMERTQFYRGTYHVLGGTLSAIDGRGPEALRLPRLLHCLQAGGITEVILATSSTVEGQATAHYIAQQCGGLGVAVSRLAQGIPVGGELDYLDDGTLGTALKLRQPVT